MAQEGLDQVRHSFDAGSDLSSDQYKFVNERDADDQVDLAAAGEFGYVLLNKPSAQGDPATVLLDGKGKCEAGGTIDAGDMLAVNASGQAVTATAASVDTTTSNGSEDVAGDLVVGIALEDAASGDIFKFDTRGPALV